MYHVFSTGFSAILLYLISYFFYRIGYYSLQFHRKFWNSVLALAFTLTIVAGLFLALQANYKWNIPIIKSVLKWHVEFGIGMTFTGLFHFISHLNYFGKLFAGTKRDHKKPQFIRLTSADIKTNLFIAGFISSSVQFLLMREIMNITGGYELITGSFLGSWLIGSAAGTAIGGNSELNDIRKINLVFSISPIFSLLLLLFLSHLFLSPGEAPSFLAAIIYTFMVLIPFCLVSGFTFIKLLSAAKLSNNFIPGKSFSIETTGGIVSGILISALTAGFLNTYKLLLLIILLSVTYVLITYYLRTIKSMLAVKILTVALAILLLITNPDIFFRQFLLPGIKVTGTRDTPYGNITNAKYKGEESIYYNHRLLAYKDDVTEREEDIHYAMLQSDLPEKVILISGSLQSRLPEILKYPASRIIYIERDPVLTEYEKSKAKMLTEKLVVVNKDAYRFIRNTRESVDVIILLVPPPSTLMLNRYYTNEFFNEVKTKLKPGGVFMCSPGPADNYLNKESLNLYSSIYNSLAGSFKNVKPVAGNKLYLIASDNAISTSFCRLAEKRHISNIYVSPDYLEDDLVTRKSEEINSLIDHSVKQNRSAFPYACFHSQSYQFSKNLNEKIPALVLMIVVFALPAITLKRKNLLMYFSASALAGFEILILVTLQITVGNMYQMTGLVIAGLMTGLAVGSGVEIGPLNAFSLRRKVVFLMIFYFGFGMIINYLTEFRSEALSISAIIFSVFLPGLFTGHIFRELTRKTEDVAISSALYSADLAGSALGFIFISGFAIPLLGIQVSVFLLSALISGGILFSTISNK